MVDDPFPVPWASHVSLGQFQYGHEFPKADCPSVYIRSVEGLSNYGMGLEVGLVCLAVLGNCRKGSCTLRNCSVTEMNPVAFVFKPVRTSSGLSSELRA